MLPTATDPHESPPSQAVTVRLQKSIAHAAHLLPAQGPITVFIHHNTLHAFEQIPFDRAVQQAAEVFGCEPYLSESRYREALARGRIRLTDLQAAIHIDLGSRGAERIAPHTTRTELRSALLRHTLATGTDAELRWHMAQSDALRVFRPEAATTRGGLIAETRRWVMRDLRNRNSANPQWVQNLFAKFRVSEIESWPESRWESFALESLWELCLAGVRHANIPQPAAPSRRHRDLFFQVTGIDVDLEIHDLLIRFTAAYLDQGVSHWPLPDREDSFLVAFCKLYSHALGPPYGWLHDLSRECARQLSQHTDPYQSIHESLVILGVPEEEWDDFLCATLLALRGWAGMVRQVEERPDRVSRPVPSDTLAGFAAVRLLLKRLALMHFAQRELGYAQPLDQLRDSLRSRLPRPEPASQFARAFPLFQLSQILGWTPEELNALREDEWTALVSEVEAFPAIEWRRVFHAAYERRFRDQCLDALALHPAEQPAKSRFQLIACIDEREESFRRHIEEIAPDCETYGAAGFFAVPMYYKGVTDAHFVPLCPIVLTPQHYVEERPEVSLEDAHQRLKSTRRFLAATAHRAHIGSRMVAFGAILTGALGVFATIPLVLRTLFPRLAARVRGRLGQFVKPPRTRLQLERPPECRPAPQSGHIGFTIDEMANQAERLLRDIGLTQNFSRIVFVIGHGSTSLNNPHKSAYDCGACGGSPGAPNGRAAAAILNEQRVREKLATRGIIVPAETRFVGGYHNTCNDSVTLFDLEEVPESHRGELEAAWQDLENACDRNAHERCRRFMSAPLTLTPSDARRHVEGRSEDLAQTRPELGHATNALCVVGRRSRTRGLFLDRRGFLTSYDPTQDDAKGTILARTMAAIFPVCGGINLEYFFSHVDSMGYGCGTKLPHNITALLGVMDGAASDLRTGLPWQMVEIHEPVRLLIVCETTPEVMNTVLAGNSLGQTMTQNGWIQLALLSPTTNELQLYQNGSFVPYTPTASKLPTAVSSADWYRGWREHLEFAEIARA